LYSFLSFSVQGVVAGEVDEHALMSRKSRTQVFSGRRLQAGGGSLYLRFFTVYLSIYIEELLVTLLQNYDDIILLYYSADSKFPINESF